MILLLTLIVLCTWTIHFRFKRKRMYELVSKIPLISGSLPVLGITHRFIGNTEHILTELQKLSVECMKLGGTAVGWLGHLPYFMTTDPEDLDKVLKSCLEKDDAHRFLRNIVGNGVVFAPVSIWRKRRKIMTPSFAPKFVESFIPIFVKQSKRLVDKLESTCGTGQFDVWPYINRYTLESICETALGLDIKAQEKEDVPFLSALNRVTTLVSERIFQVWLQPNCIYKLFRNKYVEHEACRQTILDFVDEVISRNRKKMITETEDELSCTDQTFLELLIKLSGGEKGYSDLELREELLNIIIAAIDTSTIVVSNTLVLLTKYPKVQEAVEKELAEVFKDSDRDLVKEDLSKLKYLERVIKESMRLYPVVAFLARKVLSEITLPSGYTIPVGTGIVGSLWGIHRDPKYWGVNADHFDPDRFLPERYNLPHPCCYLPFGSGPRNCVGSQYAMLTMKTSLSSILRRYRVVGAPENAPVPRMRMKFDLLMKAADGYLIGLEKKVKN